LPIKLPILIFDLAALDFAGLFGPAGFVVVFVFVAIVNDTTKRRRKEFLKGISGPLH
jgi:hypothetical protein